MLAKKWWVICLTVPDGHPFVLERYSIECSKEEMRKLEHDWSFSYTVLDILEAN